MKKIFTLFPVLILILSACSSKRPAIGREDQIVVVADSAEYAQVESSLQQAFGKVIYTPQPEHLFKLKRVNISKFNDAKKMKNVIILAPLNSGSNVSKYLNTVLDSTSKNMVLKDSVYVINRHDLWARDQLVMILTAPTIEKLRSDIFMHADDLLYFFRDESNKRLSKALYNSRLEKVKIEAGFLKKFNWIIYVPADYQLSMEKDEDNFVWLRRGVNTDMERWIFIHWIDNASPTFLDPDSIANERNKITKKYYRTTDDTTYVELYDAYKMSSEVNFNGRFAIMTQGLWRFSDQSGGGPYIDYAFYDEDTGRIYMLDASIFAPKYQKKDLIQQVDVLLHSFKTGKEISPEKKKELMESLED